MESSECLYYSLLTYYLFLSQHGWHFDIAACGLGCVFEKLFAAHRRLDKIFPQNIFDVGDDCYQANERSLFCNPAQAVGRISINEFA